MATYTSGDWEDLRRIIWRMAVIESKATEDFSGWDRPNGYALFPACWHTRDSDALEESNFAEAWARFQIVPLERENAGTHEPFQANFGHWAVGWIEGIAIPLTPAYVQEALSILDDLEGYPVLNEEDYSEREFKMNHPDDDDGGGGDCYSDDDDCPCGRR